MSRMKCNANPENLIGYRIKLYPTEDQKHRLNELISAFRYVYNWTIGYAEENYTKGNSFVKPYTLFKIFSDIRNEEGSWLKIIPINTARHAILQAYHAYEMFFDKSNKHPPKYNKKKYKNRYFIVRGDRLYFKGNYVRIEGFKAGEMIYCDNHNIPHNKKYYGCTVTFDGIDYWLSLNLEGYIPFTNYYMEDPIGVDLGLRTFATLSDGTEYNFPVNKHLHKRKKKLQRRLQKNITQAKTKSDKAQSKNTQKIREKLIAIHHKLSNIKYTFVHTFTKQLVERYPKAIVIEDLNVESMMKNKYLAKYLSHSMFREVRSQLEYKTKQRDIELIVADQHYPSTKKCSRCGALNNIGASKTYKCKCCGLVIDRDYNAALNLKSLATV